MFPLSQKGHDFKPRKREDVQIIIDLLSAELFLPPSMEDMQPQLRDRIGLGKRRMAERSVDLDPRCLPLVFDLLGMPLPLANYSSALIFIFHIFRNKDHCTKWLLKFFVTLTSFDSRWWKLTLVLRKWRAL